MCVCFRLAAVVAVVVVMMTPTAISPVDKTAVRLFAVVVVDACLYGNWSVISHYPSASDINQSVGGKSKQNERCLRLPMGC